MALIKCSECGAEMSSKAEKCPQCGHPRSKPILQRNIGCGGALLVIIILSIIGLASINKDRNSSNSSSQSSTITQNTNTQKESAINKNTTQGLTIGEEGILKAENVDPIFLATDEDSFDSLSKALLANDPEGVVELVNQNKVFGVSSGSKVKVIDKKTFIRKIRILEGVKAVDADKVGLAGWVPYEWVVKQ